MDEALTSFDFAICLHLREGAIERLMGKPQFDRKVLEGSRHSNSLPAGVGVDREIMPHAVASGMDVALFEPCPQHHHLTRKHRGESLCNLRIAGQLGK